MAAEEIVPGVYKHFKGKAYSVIGTFRHTETDEVVVVVAYQQLYHPFKRCVRPLTMFTEDVDRPELSYRGPRFILMQRY